MKWESVKYILSRKSRVEKDKQDHPKYRLDKASERRNGKRIVWIFRCDYYLKTFFRLLLYMPLTQPKFPINSKKKAPHCCSLILFSWNESQWSFEWSNFSIIHNHNHPFYFALFLAFIYMCKRNEKTHFIHAKSENSNKASRSRKGSIAHKQA